MREQRRKYLQIALCTAVSVICLWLAVPGSGVTSKWQGVKATGAALGSAEYWWLIVLIALLALFFLSKAYRWAILLRPVGVLRTHQVFPAMMIGFMGNNILPAHLGEFLRMYALSKDYMLGNTPVFSSIVLERVLDAMAVAILLAVTGLWLELPKLYKVGGMVGGAAVFLSFLILMLYVYHHEHLLRYWKKWFGFLPHKLHARIDKMITSGAQGLQTLQKPGRLLYLILFSIAHWSLLILYIHLVLRAFSIDLPFSAASLVLCGIVVGVMIPSAPGYWGVVQAVFTLTLKPLGVPQQVALAASVYYLASQYIPITVTGLIFMGRMGLHLDELRSRAEALGGGH